MNHGIIKNRALKGLGTASNSRLSGGKRKKWLLLYLIVSHLSACGNLPKLIPDGELPLAQYMAQVVTAASQADIVNGRVLPGSYIVTFKEDAGKPAVKSFSSFQREYQHHYGNLAERFLTDSRVVSVNYITSVDMRVPALDDPSAEDAAAPPALRLAWQNQPSAPQTGIITEVTFKDPLSALTTLKEWQDDNRIWFAEPNYTSELVSDNPKPKATTTTLTTNSYADAKTAYDQLTTTGWWHKAIKLSEAFSKIAAGPVTDLSTPVIAVLDSGADINNPILKDRIWVNGSPGESGCDGDINGCDTTSASTGKLGKGSVYPYSTSGFGQDCPKDAKNKADESCAHGTHVAGIIAGNVASGNQVGGVCPVCQVMVIKIIKNVGGKGVALDSAILNGLKYLTLFKQNNNSLVRVANTSFGKYSRSRAVSIVVSVLKQSPNEVLLIGAAGNEDSMLRVYPAALNDAIAVSATGLDNQKAYYSNYGPWVDVAAPGGRAGCGVAEEGCQILSSVPTSGGTAAEVKQGTSMASPVVAGIAGMILSADPGRSWQQLRDSIINTADQNTLYGDPGSLNASYYYPKISGDNVNRPLLGSGLVDAAAAFDNTASSGVPNTSLRRINNSCSVVAGYTDESAGRWTPLILLLWFGLPLMLIGVDSSVSLKKS